jgi:hypothetical protein
MGRHILIWTGIIWFIILIVGIPFLIWIAANQ